MFYTCSVDMFLQYNADLALASAFSKKNDQKAQQILTHLMILEVVMVHTVTQRTGYFIGLYINYTFCISMCTRKYITEGEYNLW